jgi:ligand-binding sensor domain-containing protein
MRQLHKLLVTAAGLAIAAGLPATASETRISGRYLRTQFTYEDGLTNAVINDLVQSGDGFLWMSTERGSLIRFDGQRL